ncbi:MAG TPA: sulfurtransferase [Nitrospirae bacterium]|nr:sulfurtransferase [Nitrospirota bacterium]
MKKGTICRLALLTVLGLAISYAVYFRENIDPDIVEGWIVNAGPWGPVIFVLLYALAAILFLPGSALTLMGGIFFGPVGGALYSLLGATIGASISFLISRYVASEWVARKSGGRLESLIKGVEAEGWRFVAFTRLVPVFPFNLLNYALGLTKIRFSSYTITSFICMFPGSLAYSYLGFTGKEALTGGEGMIQKVLLAVALLALLFFLPGFIKRFRKSGIIDIKQLKDALDAGDEVLLIDARDKKDYEKGYVKESINVPLTDLDEWMKTLPAIRKEKRIAVMCGTFPKAKKTISILSKAGVKDVCLVDGGMKKWKSEGLPVEGGS